MEEQKQPNAVLEDGKYVVRLDASEASILAYLLGIAMGSPRSKVLLDPAKTNAVNALILQTGGEYGYPPGSFDLAEIPFDIDDPDVRAVALTRPTFEFNQRAPSVTAGLRVQFVAELESLLECRIEEFDVVQAIWNREMPDDRKVLLRRRHQ